MRTATAQKLFYVAATFVILLLMGLVGAGDYEDQLAEPRFYCEQVSEGNWPDYKNIVAEVCNDSGKR